MWDGTSSPAAGTGTSIRHDGVSAFIFARVPFGAYCTLPNICLAIAPTIFFCANGSAVQQGFISRFLVRGHAEGWSVWRNCTPGSATRIYPMCLIALFFCFFVFCIPAPPEGDLLFFFLRAIGRGKTLTFSWLYVGGCHYACLFIYPSVALLR